MPDDSGVTVVTTLVWFYFFPREAAGASRARHSLRPLMFRWLHVRANLRKIMRRDRGGVGGLPVVVDCQSSSLRALAKQSILARIRKLDCFVVSLLAMTAWESADAASRSSSLPHLWGGWPAEGRSGGGQSKRAILRPPPRPPLRFGRPSPLKGEGQKRASSPRKRGEVKEPPSPPYLAYLSGFYRKCLAAAARYGIPPAPLWIATRDRPQCP